MMLEDPKGSTYTKRIYKRTADIIGKNKDVRLSKEILLQLRRIGLRLIPQMTLET